MSFLKDKKLKVDVAIAEKFVALETGKLFKSNRYGSFPIVRNGEGVLIINKGGEFFRTHYESEVIEESNAYNFLKYEEQSGIKRVVFDLVEPQVSVNVEYKVPSEVEDFYKPAELKLVLDELVKGTAYVKINSIYHLYSQVVNRKGGTKVECSVLKFAENGNRKEMSTDDVAIIEGIVKIMEKIRMIDYEIIKQQKDGIPSIKLKLTLGAEKGDAEQLSMDSVPGFVEPEVVIISDTEEEVIEDSLDERDKLLSNEGNE